MKNLYTITKKQLISVWLFGLVGFIAALARSEYSGVATFFAILVPAILVFLTIGWFDFNKAEKKVIDFKVDTSKLTPSKKNLKKIGLYLGIILLIVSLVFGVIYLVKKKRDNLRYNQALLKVDLLRENARKCLQPFFDKEYQEELRSCNMLKDKVKHDYNFCLSLDYIESPASCIYKNDYEAIDCSEKTIKEKASSNVINYNAPSLCRPVMNEFEETSAIIKKHSE